MTFTTMEQHRKSAPRPKAKGPFVTVAVLVLIVVITILFIGSSFRHFGYSKEFRIVGLAGIGAMCAGLPNLISDNPWVRWLTALIAGLCVGAATYDIVVEFDHEKVALHSKIDALSSVLDNCKNLPLEPKSILIRGMAVELRHRLNDLREPDAVLALCSVLNEIDPKNGHAAYYAGEAYRFKGDRENMNGSFKLYRSVEGSEPDESSVTAEDGYRTARGYFGERSAWILHIMANDAYQQALLIHDPSERGKQMDLAFRYADQSLQIASKAGIKYGFEKTTKLDATLQVREWADKGRTASGPPAGAQTNRPGT